MQDCVLRANGLLGLPSGCGGRRDARLIRRLEIKKSLPVRGLRASSVSAAQKRKREFPISDEIKIDIK
jgi:hypothetical protein